jgi:seryl-tRNA synthetase
VNDADRKEPSMMDLPLQRTVSAEWHGIAQIARQIGSFLKALRTTKSSREILITQISDLIEIIDGALAESIALKERINTVATQLPNTRPEDAPRISQEVEELWTTRQDQEAVLQADRLQLMDIMIRLNPEDAWLWEPENLAALRQAKADVAAGRVTHYDSGEEFLAALEARAG